MGKGVFITFEGIDGCGKSSMIEATQTWLQGEQKDVLVTFEPGGSDLGQQFRAMLLESNYGSLDAHTETLLFLVDRSRHVAEIIAPALAKGQIILCDRYTDSTVAYQGGGRGLDIEQLIALNDFAIDGTYPDLTILLSLPVEQALNRLCGKRDRMEQENIQFFQRVSDTYSLLAQRYAQRFIVIDASQPLEVVAAQVIDAVRAALAAKEN